MGREGTEWRREGQKEVEREFCLTTSEVSFDTIFKRLKMSTNCDLLAVTTQNNVLT